MKVYCCSTFKESTVVHHGGVYSVKRSLFEAQEEIKHRIKTDFEMGFISTNPELKPFSAAGRNSWEAVAFSEVIGDSFSWRYRYEILELPLVMRRRW